MGRDCWVSEVFEGHTEEAVLDAAAAAAANVTGITSLVVFSFALSNGEARLLGT